MFLEPESMVEPDAYGSDAVSQRDLVSVEADCLGVLGVSGLMAGFREELHQLRFRWGVSDVEVRGPPDVGVEAALELVAFPLAQDYIVDIGRREL